MRLIFKGAKLRELRRSKGRTQLDVGEAVGITDRAVSAWERNIAQPKPAHYTGLLAAYDCSALELAGCLVVPPETPNQRADIAEALGCAIADLAS